MPLVVLSAGRSHLIPVGSCVPAIRMGSCVEQLLSGATARGEASEGTSPSLIVAGGMSGGG